MSYASSQRWAELGRELGQHSALLHTTSTPSTPSTALRAVELPAAGAGTQTHPSSPPSPVPLLPAAAHPGVLPQRAPSAPPEPTAWAGQPQQCLQPPIHTPFTNTVPPDSQTHREGTRLLLIHHHPEIPFCCLTQPATAAGNQNRISETQHTSKALAEAKHALQEAGAPLQDTHQLRISSALQNPLQPLNHLHCCPC